MLRAALILALGLVTPAAADLWTTVPPRAAGSPVRGAPASATPDRPALDRGARDGRAEGPFALTVLVDPACAETSAVVQDALAFARQHGDVAVRVWLATRPARARGSLRTLVAAAEAGVTVAWVPGAVRRLAPAALPAVYVDDGQGHGVRATGRPPLEALWRRVHTGAGR